MPKVHSAIVLLLLGLAAPAAAENLAPPPVPPSAAAPECLGLPNGTMCIDRTLTELAPCTGSVDERLACLDRKLQAQADQIIALKRKVWESTTPRVSPLVGSDRF